jgi:protein-S-isoprenylcysteine O-methyltransferase Ste14
MVVAGGGIAARAMIELGPSLTVLPRPRPRGVLVKSGPYGRVRHPIYAGLIVAATGWAMLRMSGLHLVLAAVLAAWVYGKARREEAFLQERFPEYAAYRARTPRLIPRIF